MWKRMIALKSSKQEFLSKQISNFAVFSWWKITWGECPQKRSILELLQIVSTSLSFCFSETFIWSLNLFYFIEQLYSVARIWLYLVDKTVFGQSIKDLSNCSLMFLALVTNFFGNKWAWNYVKGKSLVRDKKNLFSILEKTTHFSGGSSSMWSKLARYLGFLVSVLCI